MGKALAVAAVLLVASMDTARAHAAMQVAVAVALRALFASFVQAALAASVRAAETTALRALVAALEVAASAAAVALAQSVRLRTLIAVLHAAGLAFDPAAVLVEKRARLADARGRDHRRGTFGGSNDVVHHWREERQHRMRSLYERSCGLLQVEAAHDRVHEFVVGEDRAECGLLFEVVEVRVEAQIGAVLEGLKLAVVDHVLLLHEVHERARRVDRR